VTLFARSRPFRCIIGQVGGSDSYEGGGISADIAAVAQLFESIISDCHSEEDSGGVDAKEATLVMVGCVVRNCTALQYGGGLMSKRSAAHRLNCDVTMVALIPL
jgi:hypothetical protein